MMKQFLLIALTYFLLGCHESKKSSKQNGDFDSISMTISQPVDITLTDTGSTHTIKPFPENKTITCVLTKDEKVYSYRSSNLKSGTFFSLNDTASFRNYLKQMVKEMGDSLFIMIKPSKSATYQSTIAMLDEMAINKIENYTLAKLSAKEESFLKVENFDFSPPELVAIKTPTSVTSVGYHEKASLYIRVEKNNTVSFKIDSLENKGEYTSLPKNFSGELDKIIAKYLALIDGRFPSTIYIIADNPATSPAFKRITNALKKNNTFTYQLVTSVSEVGTPEKTIHK